MIIILIKKYFKNEYFKSAKLYNMTDSEKRVMIMMKLKVEPSKNI